MALALLVAQAINFSLIFNERQRATRAQIEGPPIGRFIPSRSARGAAAGRARRDAAADAAPARPLLVDRREPRRGRRTRRAPSPARLRDRRAAIGLAIRDARGAVSERCRCRRRAARPARPDQARACRRPDARASRPCSSPLQLDDGRWLNAPAGHAAARSLAGCGLAGSTLLIFVLLLGAIVLDRARLARPLHDLTAAAEGFEGRGRRRRSTPRGPADLAPRASRRSTR